MQGGLDICLELHLSPAQFIFSRAECARLGIPWSIMSAFTVVVIDRDRICLKRFECARCMLPELILACDDLRTVVMRNKYVDYSLRLLEYDRAWRAGETSSELENYVRMLIDSRACIIAYTDGELGAGTFVYA